MSRTKEQSLSRILPPRQMRVLRLKYVHNYSFRDIGEKLGFSHETARSEHNRAIETARRAKHLVLDLF